MVGNRTGSDPFRALSQQLLILFEVEYFPKGSKDERCQSERDSEVDDKIPGNRQGRGDHGLVPCRAT